MCNVAPTSIANNQSSALSSLANSQAPPAILVNNTNINSNRGTTTGANTSLQVRALTSPVPQNFKVAAALPPRYSPLPAHKSTETNNNHHNLKNSFPKINSIANGGSGSAQSSSWQRGFVSMMMADNNSENEAGVKSDEHDNRPPPRPARTNFSQRNAVSYFI